MEEKERKNLEKKINEQLSYLIMIGCQITKITGAPFKYEIIKQIIKETYPLEKKELGFFSCAITYMDKDKEKISLIS